MLTLKTYAHAMREEEMDLGFATFGDGAKRLYPAPNKNGVGEKHSTPAVTLVELRGIACELRSHALATGGRPRTPDPQTARALRVEKSV
jgi:hypothetical protein